MNSIATTHLHSWVNLSKIKGVVIVTMAHIPEQNAAYISEQSWWMYHRPCLAHHHEFLIQPSQNDWVSYKITISSQQSNDLKPEVFSTGKTMEVTQKRLCWKFIFGCHHKELFPTQPCIHAHFVSCSASFDAIIVHVYKLLSSEWKATSPFGWQSGPT